MADQRKSIFTLFPNYESKLGDWVTEKREQEAEKKKLSIKFISIKEENLNYLITFTIEGNAIKDKMGVINLLDADTGTPISSVDIKNTQDSYSKQFSFLKSNLFITDQNLKAKLYCDGLVAETKTFKLDNQQKTADEKKDKKNQTVLGCGIEYRDQIKCYEYKTKYGPAYLGTLKMNNYSKWNDLISSNKITIDEKKIVIAMSENEGNLDAVNGYDNQIVSIGAMQKTVNPQGYGELPIQIWEFRLEYPNKYKSLLLNCGWKVEEEIETINNKESINYKIYYNEISGTKLYEKIRIGFSKENQGKKVVSIPIEPLIKLTKDVDFQAKQIEDFIYRMNQSIQKKPNGYSNKISDFIKSNLGKALVLDNDVNRPSQTKSCFGEALDTFFKKNPKVSKNPTEWEENHTNYEITILEIYGPLRGRDVNEKIKNRKIYTMTDAKVRFDNLKSKLA